MARAVILGAALVFIGILAALTVAAIIAGGFNVLSLLSLLVLAMFGVGIVGALLGPPPPE